MTRPTITKAATIKALAALIDAEDEEERIEAFATFLDDITPAGPLEALDGPAFAAVLTLAAKAIERDPAKVAERKARRRAKKAARKAKG